MGLASSSQPSSLELHQLTSTKFGTRSKPRLLASSTRGTPPSPHSPTSTSPPRSFQPTSAALKMAPTVDPRALALAQVVVSTSATLYSSFVSHLVAPRVIPIAKPRANQQLRTERR